MAPKLISWSSPSTRGGPHHRRNLRASNAKRSLMNPDSHANLNRRMTFWSCPAFRIPCLSEWPSPLDGDPPQIAPPAPLAPPAPRPPTPADAEMPWWDLRRWERFVSCPVQTCPTYPASGGDRPGFYLAAWLTCRTRNARRPAAFVTRDCFDACWFSTRRMRTVARTRAPKFTAIAYVFPTRTAKNFGLDARPPALQKDMASHT
ncbi:MAG: hypothetical protein FE78DRAFT_421175 [Acidomyces sp. 'richmondensis']|nr:MAG: hypothetical protein FE78DRAFT_421175 [Acidomyces sp. 'richmondensis']